MGPEKGLQPLVSMDAGEQNSSETQRRNQG